MHLTPATEGPAAGRKAPRFAVVVPVYNEIETISEFHRRLSGVMNALGDWQVTYVNDGSTDGTLARLVEMRQTDPHVALVNLSRNFGKEAALTAGLDHVCGDAVIVIDADLQDPPETIPLLVSAWEEGFDVVYAQRRVRRGETWLKRSTASAFYRLASRLGR